MADSLITDLTLRGTLDGTEELPLNVPGSPSVDAKTTVEDVGTYVLVNIPDATASQTGLATATQITKLDGIETLADVTDAGNVGPAIAGSTAATTLAGTDALAFVTTGGVLKRINYDDLIALLDALYPGGVAWSQISGTLSAQTDLQAALDAKQATITDGSLSIARTLGLQTALNNKLDATGGAASGLVSFSILNSGTGAHNFQINHVGTLTASHTLTHDLNNADRSISLSGNLTVPSAATVSGTNTGDQSSVTGNAGTATALATGRTITITGDLTYTSPSFNGSGNVTAAGTLATVNSNVGSFGSATAAPVITVNAKGLVTGVTTATIAPAESSVTFTDITTGDASTTKHGYLPKLPGGTTKYLRADGSFATPAGGGGATTDNQLFTTDGSWTNPSPATPKRVFVRLVGGGGGGGSGRKGAAGGIRCGGGGGAAGGVVEYWTLTTELSNPVSVTVGAGGSSGASQTTDSTNGNPGGPGGDTIFGDSTAKGGNSGGAGTATTGTAGATVTNGNFIGLSTGNTAAGAAASTTGLGGATGTAGTGVAPGGGGAGGGLSSGDAVANGGAGGANGSASVGTVAGGTAGTAGSAGGAGTATRGSGTGGGGGASSKTTNAGAGGAGGGYGSGGGGGGAALDATGNSGAGGVGGAGYALIITYL